MTCECDLHIRELIEKHIAFDLLCEMRDGDDEIGWEYVGYEVVE